MSNNGGMRKEKERKKYWSNLIDIGTSLIFSATTLLIGFQNGSERAKETLAAMAITTSIGLLSYFSRMFFVLGSVPNAILASLVACSNVMLFCFMARYARKPTAEFRYMLEVVLGVSTLLVIIIVSWDSFKAFLDDSSAKLVNSGWIRCGRFVASVAPCLEDLLASVKGYFWVLWACFTGYVRGRWARFKVYVLGLWARVTFYVRGRFGVVNPTRAEEEVELALARDV